MENIDLGTLVWKSVWIMGHKWRSKNCWSTSKWTTFNEVLSALTLMPIQTNEHILEEISKLPWNFLHLLASESSDKGYLFRYTSRTKSSRQRGEFMAQYPEKIVKSQERSALISWFNKKLLVQAFLNQPIHPSVGWLPRINAEPKEIDVHVHK